MNENSTMAFIAAVVASAAAVVAVLRGLDQLTSGARLRNLEALLRPARDLAEGDERSAVITSLHRETLGRILARAAVPGRLFIFPFAVLGSALFLAARTGYQAPHSTLWTMLGGLITATITGWMGVRMAIRLIHERARVVTCYRHGVTPIRAYTNTLATVEGGSMRELWWAVAAMFGLACLTLGGGSLARIAFGGAGERHVWLTFAFTVLGVAILVPFGQWLGTSLRAGKVHEPTNRDNSLRPTWTHPEPTCSSAESE